MKKIKLKRLTALWQLVVFMFLLGSGSIVMTVYATQTASNNGNNTGVISGKGAFSFDNDQSNKMTVWYYFPTNLSATTPVLFVMHGVKRNADEYRDGWVDAAERAGIILVVPEFSREQFPRSRSYNLGNMFSETGAPNPKTEWSFNLIEPIFDHIIELTKNRSSVYHLFGHSAGAQFAHRYLIFGDHSRLGLLLVANAGWYTTLSDSADFPYGLAQSPKKLSQLQHIFSSDVVIMLGEKDNDPNAEFLRQTPEARDQGAHRLARGNAFYSEAKKLTKQRQWPFNWRLVTVPGVGHDNKGMAETAVTLVTKYSQQHYSSPQKRLE